MLINQTLAVNGFEVVNGYSDLLSPFLGAAGAFAGASGWWSNLRTFSLDRFGPPSGGGRLPIQRYLSKALLNRITFYELNLLRGLLPAVINQLSTDQLYDPAKGSEPEKNVEVLQSWESIKRLNSTLAAKDQAKALQLCITAVQTATKVYDEIPIPLDQKSNNEHLGPLEEGIKLFAKLAETEIAPNV